MPARNPCETAVVAAVFSIMIAAVPVHAAQFVVNHLGDFGDTVPGNGDCSSFIANTCSLRAAIQEANALPGGDSILLSAGQTYVLTREGLDSTAVDGDLDIHDDVNIIFFASGDRPVVDASGLERAFEIHAGSVLMLGFDITGGNASVPGDSVGGAIAINFDAGIVQLSLLRMYGNFATSGGALYNDGSESTLSASELYLNENSVGGSGTAIFNRGTLTVDQSSIFHNGSDQNGTAAIRNEPPFVGNPSLTIINSTIASNIGTGVHSVDNTLLMVRNTSIVANSPYGISVTGIDGNLVMRNSVIAHNGFADCGISPVADLNLNRYNMDSDNTCELSSGSSNYPGVDPLLTPLARHGGFTHAIWPLTNSPVIDQGHPAIGSIGCEDDDQHGTARPVDFDASGTPRCDVGAIEMSDDVIFFDPFDRL